MYSSSLIRGFIVIFVLFSSLLLATSDQCSRNVHAFFYLWYDIPNDTFGNGTYKHWNHEVLPHWGGEEVNRLYPTVGTRHDPENNLLHSPFFPVGGPYSSTDRDTIKKQLQELEESGIGVIVVSWWGQESKSYATDTQGVNTDRSVSVLLQVASELAETSTCPIKIAFHLEPYPSRSVESVREDIEYIIDSYSNMPAFYRDKDTNKPLFYVYDSYHISSMEWRRLLTPGEKGGISIREHPQYDGTFIGLWLEGHHGIDLVSGGFDGVYTYFASEGFSYGSTMENWSRICSFCESAKKICSLSVGPGYVDTAIRPWNAHNSRDRRDGDYYTEQWKAAIAAMPTFISVTSYNEWGEGTQIEPARIVHPEEGFPKAYLDYGENPYLYLNITSTMATTFHALTTNLRDEL